MNKLIHFVARIFTGVVFVYSGFVKAVDPLGSAYKFADYFEALNWLWLKPASLPLAFILAAAEFVVGAAILFNLKPKQNSWGALLFMAIFTPLTLWLAYTNKVQDCGCFGDAVKLTNWQTFWKNVIILVPVVYLFITRKKTQPSLKCAEQWALTALITLAITGIMVQSYRYLPLLNFRPYKIGVHIPTAMAIPEGAPTDVWESTFVYSKNGQNQTFALTQLPDSTWTFVEAKHTLIKKGYVPPIHDFTITDADGNDITDRVIYDNSYNFLLISHNLDKVKFSNFANLNQIAQYANENGFGFYALTASGNEAIANFVENHQPAFEFYTADETTLKTIIRSNAGLMLIHNGVIIDKWAYRNIPPASSLNQYLTQNALQKYKAQADGYKLWLMLSLAALFAVSYVVVRQQICKRCTS